MFTVLDKQPLTSNADLMVIHAPEIARKIAPGQFVILRKDEFSERIPLTVADFDPVKGTVSVIFQKMGRSTFELARLKAGDQLRDFVGPLGKASEIKVYGRVVLVAGGGGIAPVYPIARALYEANNYVTVIMGASTADRLFWEEKLNAVCDEIYLCTDDGSAGRRGSVVDPLREQLESEWLTARVWAIGPSVMMKSCSELAKLHRTPISVNLDSIMVDGTGMCGACRIEVGSETRFVCLDGPEFDGAKVNWDSILARKKAFVAEEQRTSQQWHHTCRLDMVMQKQAAAPVLIPPSRSNLRVAELGKL